MQIGWKAVADHVRGEMVAGTLIARIDGKHVTLGQQRGTQFDFTPLGAQIAEELAAARIKEAVADVKPRRPRAPKDAATAADTVEVKVEQAIEEPEEYLDLE